ncbi:MAG: zf-HC2 domain-containing protein, partial [Gemmatimonadetes bacterium]|nr:zf-HC2 domain-containing protein [Gemmatimonadota bacterium]
MKCEVAIDLITDSLMDEFGARDSEQLQQHLASCSSCTEEAARMRTLWNTMGQLGSATANPAAPVEFGRLLERRLRSRWWSHAKIA